MRITKIGFASQPMARRGSKSSHWHQCYLSIYNYNLDAESAINAKQ